MNSTSKKILIFAVLISILLHVIILLLFIFSDFDLFKNYVEEKPENKIRIKLAKPQTFPPNVPLQKPQIPESFTRLVENPNANNKKPDKTSFLSNKSSVSSAPQNDNNTQISSIKSGENKKKKTKAESANELFSNTRKTPYKTFSKGRITSNINQSKKNEEVKEDKKEEENNAPSTPDGSPSDKIKVFDPKQVGTFALSTYEWEYAPYMTAWLRFLRQHWVAPPAYTQLGIISGASYVKFKIFPDGHMESFVVLQHEGHESLKLSSVNAVNASFPFKSLPKDFPDEYLEITLKLIYPDYRQYGK